jgi:putative flippase GtrA
MNGKLRGRLRAYWEKYAMLIRYGFFGVLTTVVNYAVYFALTRLVHAHYMAANVAAWVAAVAFAFVVNKRYVFASEAAGFYAVMREAALFVVARLLSLGMESGLLYLLVELAGLGDAGVKIVVGFVVILANYAFSKLVVFKKAGRAD